MPRSAPGSQSSNRFRPVASAGVKNAVSCLPLLPPGPAFHLPRTAAGVSTGLACLRATPKAPPDHSCWSQEWAIETTEAHRICKPLFGSQRIKSQQWGASWEFAPAACKSPPKLHSLRRQGLPRQSQSTPTKAPAAAAARTRWTTWPIIGKKVIRQVWLPDVDVAGSLTLHPRFLCFWFLVYGFWFLGFCDSAVLDLQLC